jgi:predicted ester cyclase
MSAEANKALVCRFYEEVWARGNLDVADEVFTDGYVRHDFRAGEPEHGAEGQKRIAEAFRAAFPDLTWHLDFVLAEGDLVAARWTAGGTHLGSWAGISPTGRKMRFSGINAFRFADGKVVEIWNHRDDLGLMEQLGAAVHAGAPA